MGKLKPGEIIAYCGKPWAILIALDDKDELIWRNHVPTIVPFETSIGRILIDPLPMEEFSLRPNPEAVTHILTKGKRFL